MRMGDEQNEEMFTIELQAFPVSVQQYSFSCSCGSSKTASFDLQGESRNMIYRELSLFIIVSNVFIGCDIGNVAQDSWRSTSKELR